MRRIRVAAVKKEKNTKYLKLIIIIASFILIAVIGLILAEELLTGRVSITNNTDKNIESCRIYFDDDTGSKATADMINGSINSGEKLTGRFDKFDMNGIEMTMIFEVKFEGEEGLYLYDGYFDGSYDGRVNIEFYQSEGDYFMKAVAGTGLFNNTEVTDVNTDFIFYFDEKDWDYYYG